MESTTKTLEIRRLGIIKISVSNMERARDFYQGILGFEEASEQMLSPGITLQAGEASIYLSELEQPYTHPQREFGSYPEISLCFIVQGVKATYEACLRAGVTIAGEYFQPNEHFATIQIADPDGNSLELWGKP